MFVPADFNYNFKMTMDTDQIYTAEYFANWTTSRLTQLILLAPYEPKDRQSPSQWVTGSIRVPSIYDVTRTFTVTGPKMKICFGGCNWNRIVLAMDGCTSESQKPEVSRFEQWLHLLADHVRIAIWADPSKFKPGAISNSRFTFDSDYIKPANDPSRYPDELRCRLSTRRESTSEGVSHSVVDIVDADLFTVDSENREIPIKPVDITAGSEIVPIFKFTYYRNGERFGLSTTILKAMVYPAERKSAVDNRSWVFDMPVVDSA